MPRSSSSNTLTESMNDLLHTAVSACMTLASWEKTLAEYREAKVRRNALSPTQSQEAQAAPREASQQLHDAIDHWMETHRLVSSGLPAYISNFLFLRSSGIMLRKDHVRAGSSPDRRARRRRYARRDFINTAQKTLLIKQFTFSESTLLQAVVDRKNAGVEVRIMLNPKRSGGDRANDETYDFFKNERRKYPVGEPQILRHPRKIDRGGRQVGADRDFQPLHEVLHPDARLRRGHA